MKIADPAPIATDGFTWQQRDGTEVVVRTRSCDRQVHLLGHFPAAQRRRAGLARQACCRQADR